MKVASSIYKILFYDRYTSILKSMLNVPIVKTHYTNIHYILLLLYVTFAGVCNAVYFRLCDNLIHFLPPVTAEGYDGSHHVRYGDWAKALEADIRVAGRYHFPTTAIPLEASKALSIRATLQP